MTSIFGRLRQPICSTNALASSPGFLVAFWVLKATRTTVALYVSMTTVVVELEGAELI